MISRCRSEFVVLVTLLSLISFYGWARSTPRTALYWNSHDGIPGTNTLKLYLTDSECSQSFPHGFDELEYAKARGSIGKTPRHDDEHGYMRARIHDGVLYVINRGSDVWTRQIAILQQIHRAILTAPSPSEIPNIEFTILVNDHPGANVWSLARHSAPSAANKEVNNTWLMPDYGFWSWPEPHIGSLDGVKEKVGKVEEGLTWDTKISKAVWRGSVHWNSGLRGQLMEQAKGKAWSDVQQLNWKKNALSMEDFCKYKYLMYTEGVTYSGRLRYFQLCRSIIISPPLQWRTHLSPLLHPQGPNQNIVLVKEDWSDLDDVIKHLEANPLEAERIANNTVNTFRAWYLTPAMEVCYWRKMFRAWAEVTDAVGDVKLGDRGTRWESFVLMGRLEWDRTA